ncbi:MAG: response regulator [Bacteroidetes bacterium]|nr:response regulator [Bacteroidota bacterium]MBL6943879.1 response regulator [Bacteroidales bacterium]
MGKILVVDDEKNIRDVFKRALENAGHEVMVAENGVIGQQLYMRNNIDIIILDIIMPDQEGIETIIKLKAVDSNVKIIAVSGGGMGNAKNYLYNALKLGARAVFEKPVNFEELIKKVNFLLIE